MSSTEKDDDGKAGAEGGSRSGNGSASAGNDAALSNGAYGGEEETTPHIPRRELSGDARAILNAALRLADLASAFRQAASLIDELDGNDRRHQFAGLARKFAGFEEVAGDYVDYFLHRAGLPRRVKGR